MGGLASALGNGFSQLFKGWGKGIGRAADNFLLSADARKAISDEVRSKFKPRIDLAREAENKRADNIKELGDKLAQSNKDLADAQKDWQDKYDAALATAKAQRQTEIDKYTKDLEGYKNALNNAEAGRQSIIDQLSQRESTYTPTETVFIDVNSGDRYLIHPVTGEYKNITQIYKNADRDQKRQIVRYMKGKDFDERLVDTSSGTPKVINAFDEAALNSYHGNNNIFDAYLDRVRAQKGIDLRNAEDQIKQASGDLNTWKNNNTRPADWDDTTPGNNDLTRFETNFKANNAKPTEYSFNGKTYANQTDLNQAYQKALAHEQALQNSFSKSASKHISNQNTVIAKRIQDAKNIKKAKLALGALGVGAGAGALYAGAKAMYGGDDTDTPDSIDNTDNTYTGEPDPDFNVEKEGQAILKDRQQIDAGFDPDKAEAEAVLAGAAYDKGVEDSNSVRSSDDLGNKIGASTRGHTMDDRLYELIKAMQDPYKADAVANYIYSRHGDDPEVQNLGWRGWLNKYYGDSLRSIMNIDPSGYKGMHVSGGL